YTIEDPSTALNIFSFLVRSADSKMSVRFTFFGFRLTNFISVVYFNNSFASSIPIAPFAPNIVCVMSLLILLENASSLYETVNLLLHWPGVQYRQKFLW